MLCLVTQSSDSVTLWTVAHQAPLSMGFSRQEYWTGLPFPSPGDLPYPGMEPESPVFACVFFTTEPPGKSAVAHGYILMWITEKCAIYISKDNTYTAHCE